VSKERLSELLSLFERWNVDATMIGRTLAEPRFRILDGGHTLVDMDLETLRRFHSEALKPIAE
jgi:phosphoribosylformylglycinamidine (FGAM) synthase-like enzyme